MYSFVAVNMSVFVYAMSRQPPPTEEAEMEVEDSFQSPSVAEKDMLVGFQNSCDMQYTFTHSSVCLSVLHSVTCTTFSVV